MSQNLVIKAAGLYSFPNQLSSVPKGALIQADNVVIDRENVLEPRRGYNTLSGLFGSVSTNRADQIFKYSDSVISHYGQPEVPDTLAFYAPTVTKTGVETNASNIITDISNVTGLYVDQYITVSTVEQFFSGSLTLGSNTITNVYSPRGLYAGQLIGGIGIPVNTTISSITGTGPYTVTISNVATYTKVNASFVASNVNILGFPTGTQVTAVGTTSVTLSNPSTHTSRSFTFSPTDVDVGTDTITSARNGLVNGQTVEFTSTGTLPSGLTAATVYYIINVTDNTFQLSTSSTGTAVNITTQGTGVHTLIARNSIQFYGWIDYSGTYYRPDSTTKVKSSEANNNVYFTSSTGIQKLDSITSTIVQAGAPKGLDGTATLNSNGTGFLPDDVQVAYEIVWGYKDANKNLILGAPSESIFVANTTGTTRNVDLNLTIPQGVTTDYFYQAYRTGFSATADDVPTPEFALVYEANPDSTDLTNGYVTFTDETPESLRTGAALYTNPSQEGALQANEPPPFARDITLFKGSTFYANTKTKQSLTLSILSVSSQFQIFGNTTNVAGDTPSTIRNLNYNTSGDLTADSNIITNVGEVSSLYVGQTISDLTNPSYIPADTTITEIVNSTTIVISNPATTTSVANALRIGFTGLLVGQTISGSGIPANTTVLDIYDAFTSIGDTTNTSPIVTNITSTSAFKVGQPISGTGIPSDTVVLNILGPTSITLSKNATATNTGITLILSNGLRISNDATLTASGVDLTLKNGSGGIQLNDTITIAGTTYTAKLIENVAAKQFKIFAQGSPAQNIADTSKSLIKVINRTTSPTPTIYAYYLSGFTDLPGKILFQERVFGGGIFYATANSSLAGKSYSPNLPASGTTVSSQNDDFANGLYYSKTQQPEAVPLLNFTKVGSAHAAILRIIALRDSLFILKEDGVFRLTGEGPTSFRVDLFDGTTQILAAESAVSLNNLIFMLSKYGIVTVSDTGVSVISRAIEDKMLDLFEVDLDKTRYLSFGISYESDRKYIFYCVQNTSDTTPTQAYVYNTFTQTWSRYIRSQTCGLVHPLLDVLYMGDADTNGFDVERKLRNYTDYTDTSFSVTMLGLTGNTITSSQTISGISDTSHIIVGQSVSGIGIPEGAQVIAVPSSTTITINSPCTSTGTTTLLLDAGKTLILNSLDGIEVGDAVYQQNTRYAIINALNSDANTVTVNDFIENWVLGPTTILKAIESTVKYCPQTSENPGSIKQFREASLLFQVPYFQTINIGFDTDLSSGTSSIPLTGLYGGTQWGRFRWGLVPWGGTTKPLPIRTYVPQQKQRCSLMNVSLTHKEAYAFYRLNGLSFVHNNLSERVSK